MVKLAFALTALFAFYSFTARAASPVISRYALSHASEQELRDVAGVFGLEHRRGETYEVDIPAQQSALLLALAPRAELLAADESAALRSRARSFVRGADGAGYHTLNQVQGWMHTYASERADLVHLIDYGVSAEGRKLTALHLAPASSAGKPAVMITAATHGDELITTEVLMDLVDHLVKGYGQDTRLTKLVNTHDLYFIPVLNPDGFAETNRYDGNQDPNRSYPYPGHENAVPSPSIAGVMHFFESLDLKASLDFHAYGQLTMYPWAYTHEGIDAASHARFDALTEHMAEANHYTYGPISDVIYVAPGSSADYYYWKKAALSIAIEIGQEKIPDPSEFPAYFASQQESTWRFLEGI